MYGAALKESLVSDQCFKVTSLERRESITVLFSQKQTAMTGADESACLSVHQSLPKASKEAAARRGGRADERSCETPGEEIIQ